MSVLKIVAACGTPLSQRAELSENAFLDLGRCVAGTPLAVDVVLVPLIGMISISFENCFTGGGVMRCLVCDPTYGTIQGFDGCRTSGRQHQSCHVLVDG